MKRKEEAEKEEEGSLRQKITKEKENQEPKNFLFQILPDTYRILGFMYKRGQGCEKNLPEAGELFKKSIAIQRKFPDKFDSFAFFGLSAMYYSGKGVHHGRGIFSL
jgi:TPR repeat protein